MIHEHWIQSIFVFIMILFLGGCNLASRKPSVQSPVESEFNYTEGKGDAFLYDVKIYREGKKNSVRLDVYRKNDSLALFARGYLGKGVLKGLAVSDSIVIYFPTENEYFSGKLNELIYKSCAEQDNLEQMLIDLFVMRPVELEYSMADFYVTVLNDKGKKQQFRLESKNCAESARLEYDFKDNRFLLEKIQFSNRDDTFRLTAQRRKHRLDINIPAEKFIIPIPPEAVRIDL